MMYDIYVEAAPPHLLPSPRTLLRRIAFTTHRSTMHTAQHIFVFMAERGELGPPVRHPTRMPVSPDCRFTGIVLKATVETRRRSH